MMWIAAIQKNWNYDYLIIGLCSNVYDHGIVGLNSNDDDDDDDDNRNDDADSDGDDDDGDDDDACMQLIVFM